ncbi:MAG: immunoglobulin domain-containing protein, partial [Verrucomicrobia bacterium]|nr:immunoglobulin domain-containing protein [Verrucomicrobiota bacterium]
MLTVLVGPGIAVEPVDLVVTNGEVARLEVEASGSEPLTYQWWHQETNELAGATGPVLELAAITPAQAGAYAVAVSNAVGSVRSRDAQVTVLFPPQIHAQPQELAVPRGATAEFAVTVAALPSPGYQWFFAVTNLLQNETNAVLVRTNAQAVDVGSYHVQVSNALGVVTSSVAMLWVDDPPSIVAQPQNLTVCIGQTAAFNVLASSSQPLDYHWYFEGTNLVSSTSGATLLLTNVTLAQGGSYHAVATNAFGASASQPAVLRVILPTIFSHPGWNGDIFELSFPTVVGLRYTVEYSTNLAETGWMRVVGASKLLGTGELITIQDSAATSASRFYRVLVE